MVTVHSQDMPKCSSETVSVVSDFLTAVRNTQSFECRLYTPSLESYKQKCPNSTLMCFAREVNVLVFEFKGSRAANRTAVRIRSLSRRLMSINTKTDNDVCPQCELHQEQPAEEFLLTLHNILQLINSRCAML